MQLAKIKNDAIDAAIGAAGITSAQMVDSATFKQLIDLNNSFSGGGIISELVSGLVGVVTIYVIWKRHKREVKKEIDKHLKDKENGSV